MADKIHKSRIGQEVSPIVPTATEDTHAVNLGQMNAADDDLALQIDAVEEDVLVHEQRIADLEAAGTGSGSTTKTIKERSKDVQLGADADVIYRTTGSRKQYYFIPYSATGIIPIGKSIIIKQTGSGTVNVKGDIGVTIETPVGISKEILSRYDYIELIHEKLNVWGVAGALKSSEVSSEYDVVLSIDDVTPNTLYWPKIHKSSDYPLFTTTKPYFFLYSTDHNNGDGGIWWAECDDRYYTNIVEKGLIKSGNQAETPWLMKLPAADTGLATEVYGIYYHTLGEPGNVISQMTRLMTTVGGAALHLCTYVDQGYPVAVNSGDNHNGYLKLYKKGSIYIGRCLAVGDASGYGQVVSGSNPLSLTQVQTLALNPPIHNGTYNYGSIAPFTYNAIRYCFFMYTEGADTSIALATADANDLPLVFIKNIFTPAGLVELNIEGTIAFLTVRDEVSRTEYFLLEFELTQLN